MANEVVTRVGLNNINSIISSEPTIVIMVGRVAEAKSTSPNDHKDKRLTKCLCQEVNATHNSLLRLLKWTRPIFRPSDKVRRSQQAKIAVL